MQQSSLLQKIRNIAISARKSDDFNLEFDSIAKLIPGNPRLGYQIPEIICLL